MAYSGDTRLFSTLVDIIARLRGPSGCPWDKRQTHLSLRPSLLQECYEVLEAIDQGNTDKLAEELGDLLMQVVLQAQIAADQGEFELADVLQKINTKLVSRHPHVFDEARAADAEQVALNWETLKQQESPGRSAISGLPQIMPALAYAQAMQRRAAMIGFDWNNLDGVLAKLSEELRELSEAEDIGTRTREFGDVLFSLVNAARWLGIEAEDALRSTNKRFHERFRYMEEVCRSRNVDISGLSMEKLDDLWEEAKKKLP